jgi:hypothetical protein
MTHQLTLFAYETRKKLRELTADEADIYQAMLDTFTAAEKEYGVVEGRIFGIEGLVYAQGSDLNDEQPVTIVLNPYHHRKLKAIAAAQGMTTTQVLESLLDSQPSPSEITRAIPRHSAEHLG